MQAEVIAAFVEFVQSVHGLSSAGEDLLVREERVEGLDLHSEGLGFRADQTTDVSEGLDSEDLALNLRAGGGSELGPGHEDHHRDRELGHGVRVLARGVHHHHAGLGRGLEVHIVISGACAHHYLELRCSCDHLGGHLVRADDDGFDVLDGRDEIRLLGIFFEFHDLMASRREDIRDAAHRCSGKGLLGCK